VQTVMDDVRAKVQAIRSAIRAEEVRLRRRYRLLIWQNLLGLACFVGSIAALAGVAWAYLCGHLPWWFAIPSMALPISILHELEHDLIHDLYFRSQRLVQNLMFTVIWICKLGLNPWYRRELHLLHHQKSGQVDDIEERLIGIGMRFGWLRLLVTLHPLGAIFLLRRIHRDVPEFRIGRLILTSIPTYGPFLVLWELFCGYLRQMYDWLLPFDPAQFLPEEGWPWICPLGVLILLPNMLRQACLVFLSSYSHYYGDVPQREVYYQNQILSRWFLLPLQIFCFNFGSTHIIHHYVVNQPFYLRQMVARVAHEELKRQGVRVNDLDVVSRSNRWGPSDSLPAYDLRNATAQT
jgi:fatty acid desaturase